MAEERQRSPREIAVDEASIAMLEKADADGVENDAFSRADEQGKPCVFGTDGVCCRICHMGPCKISEYAPGVCGATVDTVAARNLLRQVAAGTSAHSDHARHLVHLLADVAQGRGGHYRISDETRLRAAARLWGIEEHDLETLECAGRLAELFTEEFRLQDGSLKTLELAPKPRQAVWKRAEIAPSGIDRTIVEAMHRTNMGVDHDYRNLIKGALKVAIADGWGGSMIATTISDILFGTPKPVKSRANLGVLEADMVNVLVHGHEPALTEMLVVASHDPEIRAAAAAVGAKGVNLAGICCTANEVLMRHGVPVAGNFLQQELAIVTGAVELMVTDVQCCMASLPEVAKCYHTKILTSNPLARNDGAEAVHFEPEQGLKCAKEILRKAIANYPHRDPKKVAIPNQQKPLVAGFSNETIFEMLGGRFRRSFRPLNDAIITGRVRGVCAVVGCTNARGKMDEYILTLTQELIARNVLVLQTGCAAVACGKAGFLTPETALEMAGPTLREVCEAVGIPPVLHMGSCVDNSRLLMAVTYIVEEGGLGADLSEAPVIGAAPEWMSEKAIAIGHYFVASGVDVVLGHPFHTMGSKNVTKLLCGELESIVGAKFHYISNPARAVEVICEHLEKKRNALGINKQVERKLLDMKDRRELHV
ncbi:MAG: anaerobic carbon-monoxide dehydrogenase catalytic subunit [Candidatus Hydrogenedentes bacterium]|nr:anaerobic carbon-monoxide dehydrogenase catalytic subunit [Candidatus Hydrogenedentota bacterium]